MMNRLTVNAGHERAFEEAFAARAHKIEGRPGFVDMAVLRPSEGNTYIVLSRWDSEASFDAWVESPEFAEAHKKRHPGMFAGHPVLESYTAFETGATARG